jgi:hypothetical protein
MRNRTSAIISGLGIIAVIVALTPDPVAARGGRGGGGFAGRGAAGIRGGAFAGRGAMATGGFGRAAIGRPAWGGGWAGRRAIAVGRPVGWGWGGRRWRGGWGWPVAAGIATGVAVGAAAASPWGWGDNCMQWNGFRWVNVCAGSYAYSWGGGWGGW